MKTKPTITIEHPSGETESFKLPYPLACRVADALCDGLRNQCDVTITLPVADVMTTYHLEYRKNVNPAWRVDGMGETTTRHGVMTVA